MKLLRWSRRIVIGMSVLGFILLGVLLAFTYRADNIANDLLNEDFVSVERRIIIMEPEEPVMNLVFYQGGLVQTEAYLVLLESLRASGVRVFIPRMPLNLAIINRNVITTIYDDYPSDLPWVAMGHSLGGASLSFVVDERFDALIFLASYPANSEDLSNLDLQVLSITASNDMILNWEQFEDTKKLLPEDTLFIDIAGGNHANFGHYGVQQGDGKSLISKELQQRQTIDIILDFLNIKKEN